MTISGFPLVPRAQTRYPRTFILACTLFAGTLNTARAQVDWDSVTTKACPEAGREVAQIQASRPPPKDVADVSRPALRAELLQME